MIEYLSVADRRIAFMRRDGKGPGLIWFGGFCSEMTATKASHLDAYCAREGYAFTRFDYSGHGKSSQRFEDCTMSTWIEDALAVITKRTTGPQILIGSSMGGWVGLRVLEELIKTGQAQRIAGLVLIAPAPDFTERLMWAALPTAIRQTMRDEGVWMRPSAYAPQPTPITYALIVDGRKHLVLERGLDLTCPVHILHGTADPDVPFQLSLELMGRLRGPNVRLTLLKDGDHRLSSASDLAALENVVKAIKHQ